MLTAREHSVEFGGEAGELVGVLCEPDAVDIASQRRAGVVLFNSGIIHRIGAHRLNVKIARAVATLGFPSLRFDLSGLGDSRRGRTTEEFTTVASRNLMDAISLLTSTMQVADVVVVGLCSGADDAFRTASRDRSITGLVLIDPYMYPTSDAKLRYFLRKFASAGYWMQKVSRWFGNEAPLVPRRENAETRYVRRAPPKEEFADALQAFLDRGGRVLVIYSGGSPAHFNHKSQFSRSFSRWRLGERVKVEFFEHANHTFTEVAQQERLISCVSAWLDSQFPLARPSSEHCVGPSRTGAQHPPSAP